MALDPRSVHGHTLHLIISLLLHYTGALHPNEVAALFLKVSLIVRD